MNPNTKLINLYEENRQTLTDAIIAAGGSGFSATGGAFKEVLIDLSSNNIKLKATYVGGHVTAPKPVQTRKHRTPRAAKPEVAGEE